MNEKEIIYLSRQFANMFGYPVRLYKNNQQIYSFFTVSLKADPVSLCLDMLMSQTTDVSYYVDENHFYYGIVNFEDYKFIAGPVSEVKMEEKQLKNLASKLNVTTFEIPHFKSEIQALCGTHLDTLLQSVILYNFNVNKTMYDISDIRIADMEQSGLTCEIKNNEFESCLKPNIQNNAMTISIEKDIVKKIVKGDVEGLIDGATKIPAVSSGNYSSKLIRHQKNFFIKLETIASRAAIEAGLDIDEILNVEEMYINKCEELQSVDRIKNLQYHMLIDYASRVKKQQQYNSNNSRLVNEVSNYIRENISESIKTSDIADYFGKSRVSVTNEFKNKTGINLSDFINITKIQEAKELLHDTDVSLIEISNHLGFSSQSHFCKVFKKITGITPTEFKNTKSTPNIIK